ncbi:tRNA-dihydrouridine synthase 1 [Hyaloraphidium curvatum]|nr:tRNA-dihydrouridine synthase 1 [Hyaloraphidium curvatum]
MRLMTECASKLAHRKAMEGGDAVGTPTAPSPTSASHSGLHSRRNVALNEGQTRRYGLPVPLVFGKERPVRPKLKSWDFYRAIGSPKYVAAPMVDQSEYAWRVLSRRYGAQLCYTPMWHARLFSDPSNSSYREEMWQVGDGGDDEPLFVQFCANDPEHLLAAARIVEPFCEAVDLNLGCPQGIAKRGHYGAFLMDDWKLVETLVKTLDRGLERVPVTCKIRVFETVEKTVAYAKMIEAAGASMVVVHGRLREQKGHNAGLADWAKIKAVKEALSIPVMANGNILYAEDVQRCFEETGVDGVMAAETNLYNPAIFRGVYPPVWEMADEYLEICRTVPNSTHGAYIKAHLFKIFRPCLNDHPDMREMLATARTDEDYYRFADLMRERLKQVAAVDPDFPFPFDAGIHRKFDGDGYRLLPKWVVQPYLRPDTIAAINGVLSKNKAGNAKALEAAAAAKRSREDSEGELAIPAAPEVRAPASVAAAGEQAPKPDADPSAKQPAAKKAKKAHLVCAFCSNVRSPTCSLAACKNCCTSKCAAAFSDWPADLVEQRPGNGQRPKAEPAPSGSEATEGAAPEPAAPPPRDNNWEWAVLCEGHKRRARVRPGRFGGMEGGKAVLLETGGTGTG